MLHIIGYIISIIGYIYCKPNRKFSKLKEILDKKDNKELYEKVLLKDVKNLILGATGPKGIKLPYT